MSILFRPADLAPLPAPMTLGIRPVPFVPAAQASPLFNKTRVQASMPTASERSALDEAISQAESRPEPFISKAPQLESAPSQMQAVSEPAQVIQTEPEPSAEPAAETSQSSPSKEEDPWGKTWDRLKAIKAMHERRKAEEALAKKEEKQGSEPEKADSEKQQLRGLAEGLRRRKVKIEYVSPGEPVTPILNQPEHQAPSDVQPEMESNEPLSAAGQTETITAAKKEHDLSDSATESQSEDLLDEKETQDVAPVEESKAREPQPTDLQAPTIQRDKKTEPPIMESQTLEEVSILEEPVTERQLDDESLIGSENLSDKESESEGAESLGTASISNFETAIQRAAETTQTPELDGPTVQTKATQPAASAVVDTPQAASSEVQPDTAKKAEAFAEAVSAITSAPIVETEDERPGDAAAAISNIVDETGVQSSPEKEASSALEDRAIFEGAPSSLPDKTGYTQEPTSSYVQQPEQPLQQTEIAGQIDSTSDSQSEPSEDTAMKVKQTEPSLVNKTEGLAQRIVDRAKRIFRKEESASQTVEPYTGDVEPPVSSDEGRAPVDTDEDVLQRAIEAVEQPSVAEPLKPELVEPHGIAVQKAQLPPVEISTADAETAEVRAAEAPADSVQGTVAGESTSMAESSQPSIGVSTAQESIPGDDFEVVRAALAKPSAITQGQEQPSEKGEAAQIDDRRHEAGRTVGHIERPPALAKAEPDLIEDVQSEVEDRLTAPQQDIIQAAEVEEAAQLERLGADRTNSDVPHLQGQPDSAPESSSSEDLDTVSEQEKSELVQPPVPLEEAWPVRRIVPEDTGRDVTEKSSDQKSISDKPVIQRKTAGGDPSAEKVDEALKEVASRVQSDSAIELVTPRRPRPIRKTVQKQPIEEAAGGTESLVEDELPAIKQESTKEEDEAGNDVPDDRSELPSAHDLIQTEVGELPSDFWRLLGEEAPKPKPPKLDTQGRQTSLQRKEADSGTAVATADRPPLQEALTAEWGEAVQRVDLLQDRGRAEEVSDRGDSETESDIDIDKLSRLVYRAIKRKLMIESERSKGRF